MEKNHFRGSHLPLRDLPRNNRETFRAIRKRFATHHETRIVGLRDHCGTPEEDANTMRQRGFWRFWSFPAHSEAVGNVMSLASKKFLGGPK